MRSIKFLAPAFAEAPALRKASGGGASRRQANNQIMTKIPMIKISISVVWKLDNWKLFRIWILEFGV